MPTEKMKYKRKVEFLNFMFSKKATTFDKIFTVNLTLCSKCQIFVAFLENMNFSKLR